MLRPADSALLARTLWRSLLNATGCDLSCNLFPIQVVSMRGAAVDVHFDSTHLLLDLSDGQAV